MIQQYLLPVQYVLLNAWAIFLVYEYTVYQRFIFYFSPFYFAKARIECMQP